MNIYVHVYLIEIESGMYIEIKALKIEIYTHMYTEINMLKSSYTMKSMHQCILKVSYLYKHHVFLKISTKISYTS